MGPLKSINRLSKVVDSDVVNSLFFSVSKESINYLYSHGYVDFATFSRESNYKSFANSIIKDFDAYFTRVASRENSDPPNLDFEILKTDFGFSCIRIFVV